MTKNQENKLSSYHLTEEKLNLHNGTWAGIPAFSATKISFSNKIVSIHTAGSIQQGVITGIATDKKVLKLTMIDGTASVAGNLKSLATETNNNELFDAVNFSHTKLVETRDENIADICQTIHNHANIHLAALAAYGVTAPVLAALQLAIDAYHAKVPAPGSAKVTRKTATANLRNLFTDTDKLLKNQLDPMMLQFKNSEPDFFADYTSAREIIDLGSTHTRFRVFVKDNNGTALSGASISLLQNNVVVYTIISAADGNIYIPKVKPGTFDLKVQKTNFQTKNETGIVFKAGKQVKRTVTLISGAAGNLITISREADLPANSVANIDLNGINTTGLTLVSIEVTLAPLSFYASAAPGDLPGLVKLDRPIGNSAFAVADFATAVGFGSGNNSLNVQNATGVTAHYKLTFNNLEP